jgi:hypothetical protein
MIADDDKRGPVVRVLKGTIVRPDSLADDVTQQSKRTGGGSTLGD